jgi:proline racemase
MALHIVVHPRFGDTARVATDASGHPQLVADIDTGGTFSVQVNDEPGSTELAAQFTRDLAAAALRFVQRCTEVIPGSAIATPAAPGDSGASNRT